MRSLRRLVIAPAAIILVVAIATTWAAARTAEGDANASPSLSPEDAFATVARVLRHPRCLNCHPSGDVPRVGEARRPHAMNVQRGRASHGVAGLKCSACHQRSNQDLAGVPGAPSWHLAPRSMGWEGLDDHLLAETLKDEASNGGRSLADLLRHMRSDPLVEWAWNPGKGRTAIPISHERFVEAFGIWIDNGAVSPPPGITTY